MTKQSCGLIDEQFLQPTHRQPYSLVAGSFFVLWRRALELWSGFELAMTFLSHRNLHCLKVILIFRAFAPDLVAAFPGQPQNSPGRFGLILFGLVACAGTFRISGSAEIPDPFWSRAEPPRRTRGKTRAEPHRHPHSFDPTNLLTTASPPNPDFRNSSDRIARQYWMDPYWRPTGRATPQGCVETIDRSSVVRICRGRRSGRDPGTTRGTGTGNLL
jgi:hypothetical protein